MDYLDHYLHHFCYNQYGTFFFLPALWIFPFKKVCSKMKRLWRLKGHKPNSCLCLLSKLSSSKSFNSSIWVSLNSTTPLIHPFSGLNSISPYNVTCHFNKKHITVEYIQSREEYLKKEKR